MADTVVQFSLAQLYGAILGCCALVTAVAGVVAIIARAYGKAKAPEVLQDERLTAIEKRLARHDELFAQDNERLKDIEESDRLMQRGILALLRHGIDGNDVQAMKDVQSDIERYLINK